MKRFAAAAVLLALATACVKTGSGGVELTVAEPTVTTHDGRIGVGAALTLTGASAVTDVELDVRFLDGSGELVREETETLPACSNRCLWGASYIAGEPERKVARAAVEVRRYARDRADGSTDIELDQTDDGVTFETPADPGRVVVVTLTDGKPTYGISVDVGSYDEDTKIPAGDLPAHDEVVATFYPGAGEGGEPGAD